jgi:hypothetical protein
MMETHKGVITGHYMAHWGVPMEIRPLKARGISEFAILEFKPRRSRLTWRYATNGMSSFIQYHPENRFRIRTELFVCTKERQAWIAGLLTALASYPLDYCTCFTEGDTIDVGKAIDQINSCYTGILLAPPGPADPPTVGLVGGTSENILVHQVVGLLSCEVSFSKRSELLTYPGADLSGFDPF